MADERYKAAVDAAVDEVNALLASVVDKKKLANTLAQLAGIEPPFADVELSAVASGGKLTLRPDQFANFPKPAAAARAFLEMRGEAKGATTVDVIYDALVAGGFAFTSIKNDPKGGLRIALGKDEKVRRLPNDTYGLWEWYPQAKRDKQRAKKNGDSEAPGSEDGSESSDADDSSEATP